MRQFRQWYFLCLALALFGGIVRLHRAGIAMGLAFWGTLVALLGLIGGGLLLWRRAPLKPFVLRGIQPLHGAAAERYARKQREG